MVMQGFGVRLPQTLVQLIDVARGDVNRSRYLQRLIEKNINENTIPQIEVKVGAHTNQSVIPSTTRKRGSSPNG